MKKVFTSLMLLITCLMLNAQVFVSQNSNWKYLDNGSDQGTTWSSLGFNDASWASGNAQLGYGDGDETTVVGYGPDANNKYPTTYFRQEFNVINPGNIASLDIDIQVDDGAVVYLNGVELFRQGMPTGSINYQTYANFTSGGADENIFTPYNSLPASGLVAGTNVIAVEVHQAAGTSSDISFNLQMESGAIPGQPDVTRGPYLQMATPTSILVKWRTDISSDAEVRYGTSPGNLNQSVVVGTSSAEHAITLSGLAPNTTYYYALANSTGLYDGGSSDYTFKTAPNPGTVQPVRAWILGDAGTATQAQRNVRDAYKNYANTNGLHTDMILMLGDNAYNSGTDNEYQNAFFNIYPEMLRKTAVWSTRGNHDSYSGNNYYDIFNNPTNGEAGGEPSMTEAYFSYDYGNIHFISLNSESESRNVGGTMYNWCQTDLMNTNADWVVVFFHHPPYTKGSHDSDSESQLIQMRQNFLPLLEAHGVDLVLSGHSHSYERTFLLKGHYGSSGSLNGSMILDGGSGNPLVDNAYSKTLTGPNAGDGAVYITAGSSGKITGSLTQHPAMYSFLYQLGSVVMEVENTQMHVRFLNDNGSFTDEFIIEKNDLSNQAPVAANDADNTFQNISIEVDVLANDNDPNGSLDPTSVAIVSGPTKGSITGINPTTGAITYLPNPGESGNDVFSYTVCDDGVPSPVLCDNATVTINIQINSAPTAVDDSENTNENVTVDIDVVANDTDSESNLDASSVTITQSPANGNITNISATGVVTYDPNTGITGSDVFKYTVSDDLGLTSNEATVTINVLANVAPTAGDDSDNTTENTLVLVNVLANDSDLNGDLDPSSISTTGLTQPSHGTTNVIPGVGIEYTPSGGYSGYDQFEYQICDQSQPTALCDIALVTVFINCDGNSGITADVISGSVFEDNDNSGTNVNETGVGSVTVDLYVDENNDGLVDGGDTYQSSTVTAGDGTYSFNVSPVYTTPGPTLTLDIEIASDDAWEKNSGDMENDKSEHEIGKIDTWNGLRFQDAGLPYGATITSARIDFISDRDEDNTPAIANFYGEKTLTPATFNEVKYGISSRTKTTNLVNWNIPEWFQNNTHSSPDLTLIIQELVNQSGWDANSDISILIEGTGSQRRKWKAWENQDNPSNAPKLVIEYLIQGGSQFDYVLEVNIGTLPPGGAFTTDNVEVASFTATGQEDCLNDFGLVACTVGNSCDDGDACTTNDVYDNNCGCAGTFEDTDNDGVCDANDQCIGQDDALIGTACNDGNDCTINDVYDSNCGCAGTFQDTDNDGVCDANDQCVGQDDALIGTACNDGDACTINDIYDSNCGCSGTFQDTDNDGVCDANDQCIGQDDALIGTACNDGDACTINDVYDSNCGCSGTFQDTDSDGVCDANDQCVGQDDALIGTACNDGDACTINDIYDSNCGCSGTFQDTDSDGVCDANDQCVGQDDALIGTACNDGDACTINDVYDSNCGCSGTFQDTDSDGVCDANDQCSGIDDALIGTACDDGDACTTGETYDANCNCSGGISTDTDNDGICDALDQCPGTDDALIGTACDDGSACTINDIYDASCGCTGTPVADSDNDGVCDAEDQCPGTNDALIGTPCNDGNACTVGEVYDANCNCSGGSFQDSDNDGVCNANDQCPGQDDALIGTACNDGNACTINDTYDINCGCSGTFQDTDSDGVCDANDQCPGQDDALIGTACNDGDACTIGETYDSNCGCTGGVFQDSDNDGVCNANDQCPGQDDALIGTACNDGNDCTINDTYDANCGCSGTFQDTDSDGVCDANDQCPGQDDALIGTACNDGNACTINDVYDSNCGCSGTFQDTDSDGICDANDQCPGQDDALIGTACNDGNACTINDVYDSNCGCSGTFEDTDNDGVCDANDQCPGTDDALIGTACDDGNPSTINDTYDANCSCSGSLCPSVGTPCNDGNPQTINDVEDGNCNCAGTPGTPSSICVAINSGDDDVEENENTGDMYSTSTDIELVFDTYQAADNQTVGLRFNNVSVPQGASISNAYIQFTVDEASSGVTNLTITAEAADNASAFTTTAYDVSSRTSTVASANWSPADWNTIGESGVDQRTVDISSIIQEVVNRPGFTENNSMVIKIQGTGSRIADSYEGSPANAATLCIDYFAECSDTDNDGICDVDDQCPGQDDALIGTPCDDGSACTINDVYDANCGCAGTPNVDSDNDGICDLEDQCPGFDDALIGTACNDGDACTIGETYDSNCGCTGGVFQDADSDGVCDADDQCPGFNDNLDANMNNIPDDCEVADTTLEVFQINASDNDAQENNKDQVTIDDNELKLGKDRTVGLRFTGINIPANATITSAYFEFTASHDKNSDPSSVTIYGELNANAAAFVESDFNITNRPAGSSSVNWNNIEAWSQDLVYSSPDITAIIQELIDQPTWTTGNPLAFVLEATGNQERKLISYDDNPAEAPRLVINYIGGNFARVIKGSEEQELIKSNEMVLFPNPVSELLNIKYTSINKGAINIQIVNLIGQVKYEAMEYVAEGKNTMPIDVSQLPAGNYVIKVTKGTDVKITQFMVN